MAVEAKRGCGYRKVGGLYMMGGQLSAPCCRFPIIMDVCPCCSMGIRLTRTWTWVDPRPWLSEPCTAQTTPAPLMFVRTGKTRQSQIHIDFACPASTPGNLQAAGDDKPRVGLLNVGARFYPTPEHFMVEARTMGISRRINAVPRGFKLGEHWVWIAHPKIQQVSNTELDGMRWAGGVMAMFRPTRIEKVMTESQERALTDDDRDDLANKGVTPFVVPDNDRDHQGTVYDREEELI